MKRFLSFLLVLVVLCSFPLTGCGESNKAYEFEFRNGIKWGMSESEVRKLEGIGDSDSWTGGFADDTELPDGKYVRELYFYVVPFGNGTYSELIYRLCEDKLCFAAYSVSDEVDLDQIVREYTAEYGEEASLSIFEKAKWFVLLTGYVDLSQLAVGQLMSAPEFAAVAETMHYWKLPDGTEIFLGVDSLSGNYPSPFICFWDQTFKSLLETAYAAAPSKPKPTPAPTPPDNVTLIFSSSDRRDETWSLDRMRSELKGNFVLLRNSCMDDKSGCDMTLVYEVIDFAILKGALFVHAPLSEEQAQVVQSWVYRERDDVPDGYYWDTEYYKMLFPNLALLETGKCMDGRYYIKLAINGKKLNDSPYGGKSLLYNQGRKEALNIVKRMPASCDTDFEKLSYLYDYISRNVKYYHDGEGYSRQYYTDADFFNLLYDALVKKETVCAGFAYSFAYLCELAGIDAQYVIVDKENGYNSHAVVIAEIDGAYYWFDPTWDAGEYNIKDGYRYFGLGDSEMQATHDYWKTYYPRDLYPSCPHRLNILRTGYWSGNKFFTFRED